MARASIDPRLAAAGPDAAAALDEIHERRHYPFPAARVWAVVSTWDLAQWLPGTECELLGRRAGPGAERRVSFPQGTLHERLVRVDGFQLKTVALSAPFLLQHFESAIEVTEAADSDASSVVVWALKFGFRPVATQDARAEAAAFLRAFVQRALDEAAVVLRGKPRACSVETTADGFLIAKDEHLLGLPRHSKPKARPNSSRGLPMVWDFSKGFPIKRVRQQLAAGFQEWQAEFVDFCLERGVLKFGDFLLPGGRTCPYFFNPDLFASGAVFAELGRYYARAVAATRAEFDLLCGPGTGLAYAATAAVALARDHGIDAKYCFQATDTRHAVSRPTVVGTPIQGRVIIVADVVQSAEPLRESIKYILAQGGVPVAAVVALDCQEFGANGRTSCLREVQAQFGVPVHSIVRAEQVAEYVQQRPDLEAAARRMKQYLVRYCSIEEYRLEAVK